MAVLPAVMLPGVHAMLPSVHVTFPGVRLPRPPPVPGVLAGICVVDPGLAVDRVHGDTEPGSTTI
jgi:hypothetical protein